MDRYIDETFAEVTADLTTTQFVDKWDVIFVVLFGLFMLPLWANWLLLGLAAIVTVARWDWVSSTLLPKRPKPRR